MKCYYLEIHIALWVGVVPEYITWETVDRIRDEVLRRLSGLERELGYKAERELSPGEFFGEIKRILDEVVKPYCWGELKARVYLGDTGHTISISCPVRGSRGEYTLRMEIPLSMFSVDISKNIVDWFKINRYKKVKVSVW
jgi:hypothetical protein